METNGAGQQHGRPAYSKALHYLAVALFTLSIISGALASPQSSSDRAWYTRVFNTVGKAMFFDAWPTDDYDHMEFGDIQLKDGGADVSVVLYGNSWMEGKVWTEVLAEIRDGRIANIRFGRYHALIPPGTTMGLLADTLKSLNDEYQRQQVSEAGRAAPPANPLLLPRRQAVVQSISLESIASAFAVDENVDFTANGWPDMRKVSGLRLNSDFNDENTLDFPYHLEGKARIAGLGDANLDFAGVHAMVLNARIFVRGPVLMNDKHVETLKLQMPDLVSLAPVSTCHPLSVLGNESSIYRVKLPGKKSIYIETIANVAMSDLAGTIFELANRLEDLDACQ